MVSMDGTYAETGEQKTPGDKSQGEERQGDIYPSPVPLNHPFAGREVSIPELLSETIIHREEGSGTRAILEEKLNGYNESLQRFRRHICISSFKQILDLVKNGYGVSFVYDILAESDPDVCTFTIQGEPVIREFNIVYLKYTDVKERIQWFLGE